MSNKRLEWLQKTIETRQEMQDELDAPVSENVTSAKPAQKQTSSRTRSRKAEKPTRKQAGKSADPAYVQVSAYVKGQVYDDVKIELIREGKRRVFSDLVGQLLDEWLKKRKTS